MAETIDIDIVGHDKISNIMQGIFQGIGQSLANFAMQIPGAILNFGSSMLAEANEAQLGLADLQATILSTGGAAGMTEKELLDMAQAISETTRFSDDAVLAGENMLLTFTNIGKDVFPAATQALADIATKMKTDLPSAAIQLGKALNNPIEGIGALTRIGVTFSDEQKNVIEALMKTGDVAGAQMVIIAELNKEFGGQAAAAGATYAGMLDILKNRFDNIKESVGTALIPVLTELMDKAIMPLIPLIEQAASSFAAWLPSLIPFVDRIANVAGALIDMLMPVFNALADWWATNGADMIFNAMQFFDNLWRGAGETGAQIANFLMPIFQGIADWWAEYGPAIIDAAQMIWDALVDGVAQAGEILSPFIADILQALADWWFENGPLIVEFVGMLAEAFATAIPIIIDILGAFAPILEGVFKIILDLVTMTMQLLTGDWKGMWETAKEIVVIAASAILETINNLAGLLVEALGFEKNDVLAVWGDNWRQLVEIVTKEVANIMNTISQLQYLLSHLGDVGDALFSGGGSGSGHALGGSVMAGVSYPVGERGTEMFTSNTSGTIIPSGGGGGNGAINITLNYSPSVALGNRQEAEGTLLPYILSGIRAAQSNGLLATV